MLALGTILVWMLAALMMPGAALAASEPSASTEATVEAATVDPGSIEALVLFDGATSAVLQARPDVIPVAAFDETADAWIVRLQTSGGGSQIGTVTVSADGTSIVARDLPDDEQLVARIRRLDAIELVRDSSDLVDALQGEDLTLDDVTLTATRNARTNNWQIDARRDKSTKVRVIVDEMTGNIIGAYTGEQIAWSMARGNRTSFGGDLNQWYIWWAFVAAFVLVFLHPRLLGTAYTVDILMLAVAFSVSHELFREGRIEWSIPLAVIPLVWLAARTARFFIHGLPDPRGLAPTQWPPTWLAWVLAVFAAGVRYGLHYDSSNVIDVGYAGVAGADAILSGSTPYGTMPADNEHGDTYGPINYLLYVPGVLIYGYNGTWDTLMAAHAVTIVADLICVAALIFIGWRWMSWRAAGLLAAGWMLLPSTAFALNTASNDLLVAMFVLLAIAAISVPWLRGAMIGIAAAIKFVPLLALAAFAHVGRSGRVRQTVMVTVGATAVLAGAAVWLATLDGGLTAFWEATFGFQLDRPSPFSPWGLYDLRFAQLVTEVAVVLACAAAVIWPRTRSRLQVVAGAAAALLLVQIVLQHWFYLYISWVVGPLLILLVAIREDRTADA